MGLLLGCLAPGLLAASTVSTSASVRVFHDTNLYLQDPGPLAAGQTKPALPAREPATGFDAAAALRLAAGTAGESSGEISYAPEVIRYSGHGTENHTDHLFAAGAGIHLGEWVAEVKARYLDTVGSEVAPIYNELGGSPAVGGEPVRARRSQAIARVNGKVTRAVGGGFVRGVGSVFDQDFHTDERATTGYCTYADREESSAGADLGWPVLSDVVFVTGVRVGEQRQANLLGIPLNYSNSFTRWLAGLEGAPTRTVKLTVLAGPDVRHYGRSVRPSFDRDQRTWYGEGSASWTPTAADSVALTAKNYLWVLGGGRGAYVDTLVDATWKHQFAAAWSGSAGANFHDGDIGRFNPSSPRHDHIYTGTIGVSHAFAHHSRLDLDVMHDQGVSLVANTPGREYSRWITGVTMAHAW